MRRRPQTKLQMWRRGSPRRSKGRPSRRGNAPRRSRGRGKPWLPHAPRWRSVRGDNGSSAILHLGTANLPPRAKGSSLSHAGLGCQGQRSELVSIVETCPPRHVQVVCILQHGVSLYPISDISLLLLLSPLESASPTNSKGCETREALLPHNKSTALQ